MGKSAGDQVPVRGDLALVAHPSGSNGAVLVSAGGSSASVTGASSTGTARANQAVIAPATAHADASEYRVTAPACW